MYDPDDDVEFDIYDLIRERRRSAR